MRAQDVYSILRKLAKQDRFQSLYSLAKDFNIKLFENDKDLSDIQLNFLSLLGFYYTLFLDVSIGEVDKIVLEDEVYEDAWMAYKARKNLKHREQAMQAENIKDRYGTLQAIPSGKTVTTKSKSQWLFKSKKRVN